MVHTLLAYGENCVVLGGDEVLGLMRRRVAAMARNDGTDPRSTDEQVVPGVGNNGEHTAQIKRAS